jgi:uncharacterized OsmC-like protein
MSATTIREALDKAERVFAAKPELAVMQANPATARLLEGLRCDLTGPDGEHAIADVKKALGGSESGPSPSWYLRAAIASCTAMGIAMRAQRFGIVLRHLEVSVHARADYRGWFELADVSCCALSDLRMQVKIGADGASPQQLRELVEWSDAHSMVGCTVRAGPQIGLEMEVV